MSGATLTLEAALGRGEWELAALRLLLGALDALDGLRRSAPQTREALIDLLTVDEP